MLRVSRRKQVSIRAKQCSRSTRHLLINHVWVLGVPCRPKFTVLEATHKRNQKLLEEEALLCGGFLDDFITWTIDKMTYKCTKLTGISL